MFAAVRLKLARFAPRSLSVTKRQKKATMKKMILRMKTHKEKAVRKKLYKMIKC